ncbi:hypothetical protein COHA_005435 [Chlorella ohadii]|uniref:thiamine diphosphokinase n=1 Tax=Chlorella ohadii TaxID=2649997 RepID=A0AAD5H6A5_9CHLO|nr:hypothetical protein COHA_005435 [Chlorella ohadii]
MEPRILCSRFLRHDSPPGDQLAVVLLNWTLPGLTPQLWHRAVVRVCADGGANRLYDELPAMLPGETPDALPLAFALQCIIDWLIIWLQVRERFLPTTIRGDLDSIRPEVLDFYRQRGVLVEDLSDDQDTTDLQKSIAYVVAHAARHELAVERLTVVALGALGGRLDHTLVSLSTLHSYRDLNLILMGEGNLARLVPAGRSLIRPLRDVEGPTCGLVPTAGRAITTTRGLRYDMDRTEMRFGGLVSSSNAIEADEIEVEVDVDIVWTTELQLH